MEINFPKPNIIRRSGHHTVYSLGAHSLLKSDYIGCKRAVTNFIKKHEIGSVFNLSHYCEVVVYLGYTYDGKILFSHVTDGKWNVSCVRIYDMWEWPWPRLNKHIAVNKSKEELENLAGQYCAKISGHRRKQFIAKLSSSSIGLEI